jgi:phage-related protein
VENYILIFYDLPDGTEPAREFIQSLETKMRAKAVREIGLLEEVGQELREPHSKPIQEGIFELRIRWSKDTARVFYFFYVDKQIVLTNGFMKKTQKTPRKEIEKALRYKADWETRHNK